MEQDMLKDLLGAVEKRVNQLSFETWFRPISRVERRDTTLRVQVPNATFRNWIADNYEEVLDEALGELALRDCRIELVIDPSEEEEAAIEGQPGRAAAAAGAARYSSVASPAYVTEPSRSVRGREPNAQLARLMEIEPAEGPSLNQRYTFETFVVGSCNQFAHAASQAVAEAPARTYNPLYVYGGVGLGKTHLMHAIGHAIKARNKDMRLVYISSEKFMNELINAIRYDKTPLFREKYRSIDILLVDDIQFLAGKERTQEEFFHTFNALYDSQKQIVISSDCPPREIPTLEERLHSRFEWGLIADIQPPDLETKVAILKRKAEMEKIDLPDSVALFIASKIKSNIRELEGSLVRLVAYASLKGRDMDIDLAQEVLKNIIDDDDRTITIELIQKTVANHYGLRVADLKSKNNARSVAVPRQVAMYLCKHLTRSSLPEIGREFGGKHHTTVIHSVNKISDLYERDADFHRLINSLISTLK